MGVKWTFISHLPISVNNFRYRKIITDIGKSNSDIENSNFLYMWILYSDVGKWFTYIGKSKWFTDIEKGFTSILNSIYRYQKFDWPISVNRPIYWYRKLKMNIRYRKIIWFFQIIFRYRKIKLYPISVNQNYFLISLIRIPIFVNQLSYFYRKIMLNYRYR